MEFNWAKQTKNHDQNLQKTNHIIYLSFFELVNLISGEPCNPSSCLKSGNSMAVSIRYPFRINDEQPKSCGMPGFDLYCDNILGTLIQLPNDVVLVVEGIFYNKQEIYLSAPNYYCLPEKLMSLNLDNTPFNPHRITKDFWLFNCSNGNNLFDYDRIDCLSGSDYTLISAEKDIMKNGGSSNCKFVKILHVPVSYSSMQLSDISTINLNWDGTIVPPLPPGKDSKSGFSSVSPKLGLGLCICGLVMIVIFGWCRFKRNRNEQATSTISPNTITTTSTEIRGLDQVTIESYPVVMIGKSGRLIKPDNNTCPICLSDYQPLETLKILPVCLHRFHVDCIDQWLSSKGVCPICRNSPPRTSLHH